MPAQHHVGRGWALHGTPGGRLPSAGYGISFSSSPSDVHTTRFNPPSVQCWRSMRQVGGRPALCRSRRQAMKPIRRSTDLNLLSPDLVTPYSHMYSVS